MFPLLEWLATLLSPLFYQLALCIRVPSDLEWALRAPSLPLGQEACLGVTLPLLLYPFLFSAL